MDVENHILHAYPPIGLEKWEKRWRLRSMERRKVQLTIAKRSHEVAANLYLGRLFPSRQSAQYHDLVGIIGGADLLTDGVGALS